MIPLNLLILENIPILEQLKLEEALLRTHDQNWCLINRGSPPAIVMGISGKKEALVAPNNPYPVIKRYSGGGCVLVDESTLFVSFIFNSQDHPFHPFPEPIHRYAADFYKEAFQIEAFDFKENDYVIGAKKCGGNAQYIKKSRWVHHTTFLWDFCDQKMDYLKMPKRRPDYRLARSHQEFLTTLKGHFPSKTSMIEAIKKELNRRFQIENIDLALAKEWGNQPHRVATCLV